MPFEFIPPSEGTFTIELIDPEELVAPLRGEVSATIPLAPAEFLAANLDISPLEVKAGDELTVTFQLTNVGEIAATRTVILLLDGQEFARQDVSVAELTIVPVTFSLTAPEAPKVFTIEIEDLTGSFRVLEIEEDEPVARPRLQRLSVTPDRLEIGESVTVSVDVVSEADVESTRSVTLIVDGEVVEVREVTLAPRETRTIRFEIVQPSVGIHTLDLEGLPFTFEVIPPPPPPTTPPPSAPADLSVVEPLAITPEQVPAGELVKVSLVLANAGDADGVTDVVLKVRSEVLETRKDVLVPGKGEASVEFTVKRLEVGDYPVEVEIVGVEVLKGSFTVVAAPPLPAAKIVVTSLNIDPISVKKGEPVTVSILVGSEDDTAGTRTFALVLDGEAVEERDVTLEPGESETLTFTIVEEEVGTHTVVVDEFTAEFTVTEAPAGGPPIVLILALIIGVLALVGGGVVLMRKLKG